MSDVARLYGRGCEDPPEEQDRREKNLARFRRGRRAGDLVRGLFLRLDAARPGTAWIDFDGTALLAALPPSLAVTTQASGGRGEAAERFPLRPGDICVFRLESLHPEPVLRMLSPEEAAQNRHLSIRV
ncbi:MAG: hypothetical protein LBD82_01535 [Deltaproteobacteria bacterium]|jgi:hypothetical protein|nr:hypothetical protein [Deltaproteobacteria bacterium]